MHEHETNVSTLEVAGSASSATAPDLASVAPEKLKQRTARGVLISTSAQAATLVLRTGSMMVLARLLNPADFGIVGMATALTGLLGLLKDVGLSMASVQRASITQTQLSTLFWINLAVGTVLMLCCIGIAPGLAIFYREPALVWITVALGSGFLFNSAGTQHRALLMRGMHFGMLAAIDTISLIATIAGAIAMAKVGFGYWAVVFMSTGLPAFSSLGAWLATRWIPGRGQWQPEIRAMLGFGGKVTLNNIIVYFAYNTDKVLLGRFWGAATLGVYGRAYQLINLPTESLNSTIGSVLFPALSRVQNDPVRLRKYFLKMYSLFLSLVTPITVACALLAEDVVLVLLGAKWHEAVPVFRLMAPIILAFALINPFAWLLLATGRATRSLRMAFVIAPIVILGYLAGLTHGPSGVAAAYSITMMLLVAPMIMWAKHETPVTAGDIMHALIHPFLSIGIASLATVAFSRVLPMESSLLRLFLTSGVLFGVYGLSLLFVMGQKPVYLDLLRETGLLPAAWVHRPAQAERSAL